MGGAAQGPFQGQGNAATTPVDPFQPASANMVAPEIKCVKCGVAVTGKFCSACGEAVVEAPVEEVTSAKCPECGADINGNFCSACGAKI